MDQGVVSVVLPRFPYFALKGRNSQSEKGVEWERFPKWKKTLKGQNFTSLTKIVLDYHGGLW